MKIKRFFAADMREALRLVKDELGADAVILSNNKVSGGIELVAAIDYDEEAIKRQAGSSGLSEPLNRSSQAGGAPSANLNRRKQMEGKIETQKKNKKRSVFSKVRKSAVTDKLEDSIEDDVIQFSHASVPAAEKPARQEGFSKLFKQASGSRDKQDAYTQPSVQERRQPYISELQPEPYEKPESEPQEAFDYQHLKGAKHNKASRETAEQNNDWDLDDFFADSGSVRQSPQREKVSSTTRTKRSQKKTAEKVEWIQDPALTSMQEEIKSLRGILETQLSGLAWGDFSRRHPHRAELLSRLYRLGLKSSLSEELVKQLDASDSLEESWRRLLTLIARSLPTSDSDLIDEGGVIALVGPTGVGKTTNIAKLAARFTLKYGAKDLALVTTDSYRIGAHEQLKTYGRILGAPVYVADDEQELKQILARLEDKKLVLIDTAGMSPRDIRLTQQLTMLRRSYSGIKVLAVLSAAAQTLAMDEVISTFNAGELDGCIASKVDESTSIGGIISILIENRLHLNYISDGQKVPEDIHQANTKDFLKLALEMVRQHPVQVKTDELAMSYSAGGLSHAFG